MTIARIALTISFSIVCATLLNAGQEERIVFGDRAGMLLYQVKGDAVDQFEAALGTLRSALVKSKDENRRRQAESWKVYRAHEAQPGSVLFVFVIDPVVPGADYSVAAILNSELPPDDARKALTAFATAIESINRVTLSPFPKAAGGR